MSVAAAFNRLRVNRLVNHLTKTRSPISYSTAGRNVAPVSVGRNYRWTIKYEQHGLTERVSKDWLRGMTWNDPIGYVEVAKHGGIRLRRFGFKATFGYGGINRNPELFSHFNALGMPSIAVQAIVSKIARSKLPPIALPPLSDAIPKTRRMTRRGLSRMPMLVGLTLSGFFGDGTGGIDSSIAAHRDENELELIIKRNLSTPYPPASNPGEFPRRRTGNLQSSIMVSIVYEDELTTRLAYIDVYAEDYAGFLEEGTYKMEPRPFLIESLNEWLQHRNVVVMRYRLVPGNASSIDIL